LSAKIELGEDAIDYIRRNLIRFGGMWRYLSERDLASGCVFAYFPRVPSDLDSLNLDDGLFSREERQRREGDWTSRKKTRLLVKSYLSHTPARLGLLLQPSLRPGQTYPFSAPSPIGYVKRNKEEPSEFPTEIFIFLPGGEVSMAGVDYFIEIGHFWSMTCALTSSTHPLTSGAEIDTGFIMECAAKTEHILMNACDGDITLVWSPNKASQDTLISSSDGS
jgi:hypothetical protein